MNREQHIGTALPESSRIKVTFALFAYNQEAFIREAVNGAFSQTYSPLEIILSDDSSTDDTFKILEDLARSYRGPHVVILNRTERNVGLADHINQVGELSTGEFFVLAAGDDVSAHHRVSTMVDRWKELNCAAICIYSDFDIIDSFGASVRRAPCHRDFSAKTLNDYAFAPFALMASYGLSRELLTNFDRIQSNVVNEDFVFAFRSLLLTGRVEFLNEPLICYRQGVGISAVSHRGEGLRQRLLEQNVLDLDFINGSERVRKKLVAQIQNAEMLTHLENSRGFVAAIKYLWRSLFMDVHFYSCCHSVMELCCPEIVKAIRRCKAK